MDRVRRSALVIAVGILLAACGEDDEVSAPQEAAVEDEAAGTATTGPAGDDAAGEDGMGEDGMDEEAMGDDGAMAEDGMGGALGGSAQTVLLAEETVASLQAGPLAWSAFAVADVEHQHAAGFVHARDATTIIVEGQEQQLQPGDAVFVPEGTVHRHGSGTAWDVLLAAPEVEPPAGVTGEPVFRSDQLEGLPEGDAQLRTLLVELQPGTATSVHTHPGPEYIYATSGPFVYENAIIGEAETGEGDDHTLPDGIAVQKRNPDSADTAAFLSWFVVEPDAPFAPSADFDE